MNKDLGTKRIYLFHEGNAQMRDLLGGKGANLAEMENLGLPVPPGFTITTEACSAYYQNHEKLPDGLMNEVGTAMKVIESDLGKRFGNEDHPLLVSVRSGAKFSMPGMMDTILNLGLNPQTLRGLIKESGDERFAYDAYRRFIMMFSSVVLGIDKRHFEDLIEKRKKERRITEDIKLDTEDLRILSEQFLNLTRRITHRGFPMDPWEQLSLAIEAVFRSWNSGRAIVYRKAEGIPDDIGTAVNIQAMVFGNLGDDCGTGVAFTRDPSTGENDLYGEYLRNAQGEDVVAGVRTPVPISALEQQSPRIYEQLLTIGRKLEGHYKDLMDIEFTVERGRLFILQCRVAKRTGLAATRVAVEMVDEELIDIPTAIKRVTASHLNQLLHPRINDAYLADHKIDPLVVGIGASPGAATGTVVFDANQAAKLGTAGQKVILVREETSPDDVHGMISSQGILTARGGKTSHAAVVARGFGIPCVVGAEGIHVDYQLNRFRVGELTIKEGEWITIDGSRGTVYIGQVPLIGPQVTRHFQTLMSWCDRYRTLKVFANADNPHDAKQALDFGCEGIGLCRTEHMFFEADRLPVVQEMILAENDLQRNAALKKLEVMQQGDFEQIFEVMEGKPVTVRLIDPPLHEFLPNHEELLKQVIELQLSTNSLKGRALQELLKGKEDMLKAVEGMREVNPMLGLRGVRLSIIFPGIVVMQTRAVFNAAAKLIHCGKKVIPEIMIPVVSHVNEIKFIRGQLESVVRQVIEEQGIEIPYAFGTMIEIPRAALTAGKIAEAADFFSFGTNDLTQTTFGLSRDDAEGKFLQKYLELRILDSNPFETIDREGVGALMEIAVREGRKANPKLKCGICGEHAGDPKSILLCQELGLDYVSCSPFRVPIARLAAAQAVLQNKLA